MGIPHPSDTEQGVGRVNGNIGSKLLLVPWIWYGLYLVVRNKVIF